MSCNGCRVLRKGCSDKCAIRPCLQWIRSPDAQGNATVFLAKFYGRAGLINLITAGPEHVRPAIFRSLLYEACGRMLNPVYGSVGLLWSGNWQLCQAAVESVLRGMPIAQPPAAATAVPPLRTCDIRHVARREDHGGAVAAGLHRIANSSRGQFKRSSAHRSSAGSDSGIELVFSQPSAAMLVDVRQAQPLNWAPCQPSHDAVPETDSDASVDTVDVSHVSQSEPAEPPRENDERADGLDLTLGLPPTARKIEPSDIDDGQPCHRGEPVKLGLAIADSRTR
ncbi:LOB domain-containing protein 41 [Dichanthelium oligosanthes]|uniref:LOB domain-containing protein 41 n=1 Tax=Dichanthelium oligosanthes TaxID=888268 RepID=A0A1E5VTJ5_9POAL|nr:LOB domain-containing protein 41 [Dichanthelium oligosanthes]